jgi:MFS family permease
VILPGLILSLSGMIVLAFAPSPPWLILSAIIMGLGFGTAQPALMTLAVDQASPQRRGLSIAQYQLFFDLGIGLGSVALGALLDMVDRNFSTMFLAATAVGAVGLAIYWRRS